jgi:hypothetical protein
MNQDAVPVDRIVGVACDVRSFFNDQNIESMSGEPFGYYSAGKPGAGDKHIDLHKVPAFSSIIQNRCMQPPRCSCSVYSM